MSLIEYGYTSKLYPFGTTLGAGGVLPTAAPTKMIVTASYSVAPGEKINIRVWNGALGGGGSHTYQTVLDFERLSNGDPVGTNINLLDTEILLGANSPPSLAGWQTIIKASITADEYTDSEFSATETVELYCYKNFRTRQSEVFTTQQPNTRIYRPDPSVSISRPVVPDFTNFASDIKRRSNQNFDDFRVERPPEDAGSTDQFGPLSGVQAQFFSKDSDLVFLTIVSDVNGKLSGKIPPGSYDVKLHGGGFTENQWLVGAKSLAVGLSDNSTKFGEGTNDISQAAEFGQVKSYFSAMKWIGFMIVEDFTKSRAKFRNEAADTTESYLNHATYNFGRIYRGKSYIEFIGVGLDPSPL